MLEPLDNQNAIGVKVARTLVSVHGRKYCPVWNDSDQPITLKYGTPIATVSPIADIVRSCTDEESIGDIRQKTSTIDPDINKKYIHNLNILNKNINVYNTNKQQDARNQTNNTYANTRRHSQAHAANYAQSDARHSHGNDARRDDRNRTHENVPQTQQEEKVLKTIHHKYEKLNLKLENPELSRYFPILFKKNMPTDPNSFSNNHLPEPELLER